MHVVDNFIQIDLYCIQAIHFCHEFPGNQVHDLGVNKGNKGNKALLFERLIVNAKLLYIFVVVFNEVIIFDSLTKYQHTNV